MILLPLFCLVVVAATSEIERKGLLIGSRNSDIELPSEFQPLYNDLKELDDQIAKELKWEQIYNLMKLRERENIPRPETKHVMAGTAILKIAGSPMGRRMKMWKIKKILDGLKKKEEEKQLGGIIGRAMRMVGRLYPIARNVGMRGLRGNDDKLTMAVNQLIREIKKMNNKKRLTIIDDIYRPFSSEEEQDDKRRRFKGQ